MEIFNTTRNIYGIMFLMAKHYTKHYLQTPPNREIIYAHCSICSGVFKGRKIKTDKECPYRTYPHCNEATYRCDGHKERPKIVKVNGRWVFPHDMEVK